MCGIVGYVGKEQAAPILLDGLSKLEYRGYDSAGLALVGKNGIEIKKARGRLPRAVRCFFSVPAYRGWRARPGPYPFYR